MAHQEVVQAPWFRAPKRDVADKDEAGIGGQFLGQRARAYVETPSGHSQHDDIFCHRERERNNQNQMQGQERSGQYQLRL